MLGEEKYPRRITFDAIASDGRHFGDDAVNAKRPIGAVGPAANAQAVPDAYEAPLAMTHFGVHG